MTKEDIIDIVLPVLKSNRAVLSVALFGSYATGNQRPDSDVDFVVRFAEKISYFDRVELREALEEKLHKKVDIVNPDMLYPCLRESVAREKIVFYER